jgi:hypothetical protein
MMMMSHPRTRNPLAALAATLLLSSLILGCQVESHKQGDGENVKIATPFGGMSVKTDGSAVEAGTGLPSYPGAVFAKKQGKSDHDNGAADVNMSFGGFQLRVKAVSYRTPDAPDQVLAFYRKGLARFGTVIQCAGHTPVGTPTRTPDGLDCSHDDSNNKNLKIDEDHDISGNLELKAGSKQHQHIVDIDAEGTGTKFALIALDLPGHFSFGGDDKDSDANRPKQ